MIGLTALVVCFGALAVMYVLAFESLERHRLGASSPIASYHPPDAALSVIPAGAFYGAAMVSHFNDPDYWRERAKELRALVNAGMTAVALLHDIHRKRAYAVGHVPEVLIAGLGNRPGSRSEQGVGYGSRFLLAG